jgi:hypothetical protein
MRPLWISCVEGSVVISCGKVDYDNSGWRDDCVGDSISTTIIHNVSRMTSARSSEELAESHANKTTRLATEDSESPGEDSEGAIEALSRHPPSIAPET